MTCWLSENNKKAQMGFTFFGRMRRRVWGSKQVNTNAHTNIQYQRLTAITFSLNEHFCCVEKRTITNVGNVDQAWHQAATKCTCCHLQSHHCRRPVKTCYHMSNGVDPTVFGPLR